MEIPVITDIHRNAYNYFNSKILHYISTVSQSMLPYPVKYKHMDYPDQTYAS
jgi:hypothetical protein